MTRAAPAAPPRRAATPLRVDRWVRLRIAAVAAVLSLLLGAVGYRAYGLQIRQVERYRDLAHRQHIATVEVAAPRGAIHDATGAELAATADIDSIYANPQEVHDLVGTADRLGELLGLDPRETEARLATPRNFVWIERHVTPEEARAVRASGLEGIHLTPEPRRFYPGRGLAGPVLGFADIDGRGLDGIELTLNSRLTGRRASGAALRDATGLLMAHGAAIRPEPGASVTLTIDRFVQFTAERALADTIEKNRARAGIILVIDVTSGDVLAMASAPSFDPNQPRATRDPAARNRAVTDVYEIGSIMKVFTVAAALEAGVVAPSTSFDVERGVMPLPGRKPIRDVYRDEVLTVGGILKRSSNIGALKIARMLGKERLHEALLRFGFGMKTGIELPGEQAGVVREPARWGDIGLVSTSFGYGMSATPLQVVAALAAVANGGVYHAPRIVREVRGGIDVTGGTASRAEGRRVLSARTAAMLAPMLASVFDRGKQAGTGHDLLLEGFAAAGKSGTAHKIDPATGRYADHLYLASFAGYAPLNNPRVAVLVLIDEPNAEEHYGAQVAGPAWLEVTRETLRYLGYPAGAARVAGDGVADEGGDASCTSANTSTSTSSGTGVVSAAAGGARGGDQVPARDVAGGARGGDEVPARGEEVPARDLARGEGAPAEGPEMTGDDVLVPDFRGLGLAEVLELASIRCASVQVTGSGRAIGQFPSPGRRRRPAECRVAFANETGPAPRSSR